MQNIAPQTVGTHPSTGATVALVPEGSQNRPQDQLPQGQLSDTYDTALRSAHPRLLSDAAVTGGENPAPSPPIPAPQESLTRVHPTPPTPSPLPFCPHSNVSPFHPGESEDAEIHELQIQSLSQDLDKGQVAATRPVKDNNSNSENEVRRGRVSSPSPPHDVGRSHSSEASTSAPSYPWGRSALRWALRPQFLRVQPNELSKLDSNDVKAFCNRYIEERMMRFSVKLKARSPALASSIDHPVMFPTPKAMEKFFENYFERREKMSDMEVIKCLEKQIDWQREFSRHLEESVKYIVRNLPPSLHGMTIRAVERKIRDAAMQGLHPSESARKILRPMMTGLMEALRQGESEAEIYLTRFSWKPRGGPRADG